MSERRDGSCGAFGEGGCGCCEGVAPRTARTTPNRPGKSALHYRIGRHADFLDTMKARLSSWRLVGREQGDAEAAAEGEPSPLLDLRTRDPSDPSIALLDGWAAIADVLTFYQERIANEGYLRTANERRSVVELARLIGYRPRPGVAASLHLAYTIDENTKEEVIIPPGARSQSVPGPDELPQSFETSEPLAARAAWNDLKPRRSHPPTWESLFSPDGVGVSSWDRLRAYLKGGSNNVSVGDPLLVDGVANGPFLYRVVEVESEPSRDRTRVEMVPWEATAESEVVELVREIEAELQVLLDRAPSGTTNADEVSLRIASLLNRFEIVRLETADLSHSDSLFGVLEEIVGERGVLEEVRTRRDRFTVHSAPKLFPWLADVVEVLARIIDWLGAVADGSAEKTDDSDVARVKLLAKRPLAPLPNATRLPRTLGANFGAKNDAAFKLLAAGRPELAETLSTAWAKYEGASPALELEIHALRLKAGLFGRGVPKRYASFTRRPAQPEFPTPSTPAEESTTTTPVGEWPIVLGVGENAELLATEAADTIYLDGSHDGILPGSWVVLDFGALMPLTKDESRQVTPSPSGSPGYPGGGGSTLLVARAGRVSTKITRAEYGGTGDTTRITLSRDWISMQHNPEADQAIIDRDFQVIRGTSVYARSEKLELAEQPILEPVCVADPDEDYIELDRLYADLEPGRFVIVSGERADIPKTKGVPAAELGMIVDVVHAVRRLDAPVPLLPETKPAPDGGDQDEEKDEELPADEAETPSPLPGDRVHSFIRLDKPLAYCYARDAVTIRGNVVRATHGETREEVLGSGDGSKAFLSFELKQRPLTYVSAPTPDGIESTLDVFVDGVRWRQAPDFLGRGPREHLYATRTDDDSRTAVLFGDGRRGARTPTGVENVTAVYRSGIGRGGNVRAGQVSLLQSRPLGVKEVVNPIRGSGGADRESRDQARSNAPLAVKSLDRLVSVADYADFARTFAGVGKAAAAELSDGRRTVVHVTVAGAGGTPIDRESDLLTNLRKALRDFGDPFQPVQLDVRELLLLVVEARVKILPAHQWEVVSSAVRAGLLDAFGFERRGLGQDVARSEIIAAIQAVRGVDWVDLDVFGAVPASRPDPSTANGLRPATPDEIGEAVRGIVDAQRREPRRHRIPVEMTRPMGTGILPAQLAVLRPDVPATLVLNQIT